MSGLKSHLKISIVAFCTTGRYQNRQDCCNHIPRFPTRPVRPMRWTYSSMSLGRSKLMTWRTLGMSSPRAATWSTNTENSAQRHAFWSKNVTKMVVTDYLLSTLGIPLPQTCSPFLINTILTPKGLRMSRHSLRLQTCPQMLQHPY